ncbi:hypothetical protein GCM10025867_29940 [Frondihabitans sucicola]|uniref:Uncharacterized protein n=1 Tax=Frondihabitans sucicola TaxID=1268041 RepID=A0ABN6Y4Q2_9MICO|nr:hypothetical protein GCM10025867_29940 [Frondihabitans sucicola]
MRPELYVDGLEKRAVASALISTATRASLLVISNRWWVAVADSLCMDGADLASASERTLMYTVPAHPR